MKVAASHVIRAPRDAVWEALQDPAVLARTLPGCRRLEVLAPDRYAMTIDAGVASIKGTYQGTVELSEKSAPDSMRMHADAAGGPGTITADTRVRLESVDGGTRVDYDADAVVGGVIGGVGQRVLVGVTKKTAGEFFAAVEGELLRGPAVEAPAAPASGEVFERPTAPRSDATRGRDLLLAVLVGAAVALLGVLIGRRTIR